MRNLKLLDVAPVSGSTGFLLLKRLICFRCFHAGTKFGLEDLSGFVKKNVGDKLDLDWRKTYFLVRDHLMDNYDALCDKIASIESQQEPVRGECEAAGF